MKEQSKKATVYPTSFLLVMASEDPKNKGSILSCHNGSWFSLGDRIWDLNSQTGESEKELQKSGLCVTLSLSAYSAGGRGSGSFICKALLWSSTV